MTWDQEDRFYQHGVSCGVLYLSDCTAVVWNGIISVEQATSFSLEPIFFGGRKVYDIFKDAPLDFKIKSYTYPEVLDDYYEIQPDSGVSLGVEGQQEFVGFSYREMINEEHYKIHIIGNITLNMADTAYTTVMNTVTPTQFVWNGASVKTSLVDAPSSSYLLIDTRLITTPELLLDLETKLYGSENEEAGFCSFEDLVAPYLDWGVLQITPLGADYWKANSVVPGYINDLNADEFEITSSSATFLDSDTYEIETLEA